MYRIIVLVILSGLVCMLASGQVPSSNTIHTAQTHITKNTNNIKYENHVFYTQIPPVTQHVRSDTATIPTEYTTTSINKGAFSHTISTDFYTFHSSPDNPSAGYQFEHGNSHVTIIPMFSTTDLAFEFIPKQNGVKENIILTRNDPTELSWRVLSPLVALLHHDAVTFIDQSGYCIFTIPAPIAYDAAGKSITVDVSFEKNILTYHLEISPSIAWPIILDPAIEIPAGRDGRVQRTGQATYTDARDSDAGSINSTSLFVGQNGVSGMSVFRSFVSFPIPDLVTATACTLYVNGTLNASVTDFDMFLLGASEYRSQLDSGDFSHFDGREISASHSGTILNNSWSSSTFSSGWNSIVFNTAGLDSIQAAAGDTLWIAMLSGEDYANSAPTNEEYVAFESSAHISDKPYLALEYENNIPDLNRFFAIDDGRLRTPPYDIYATARDTLVAIADNSWVQTGQNKISNQYNVYRGFLSFSLPNIYSAQSCTLFIKGYANFVSSSNFNIYLVGASEYGPELEGSDFPRFDGRQTNMAHTGTILNETWDSADFSLDWNVIVFNQAGLDSLLAASGDTLRIAMLSSDDYSNTAPDGDEYLIFQSSNTSGEEPYLAIDFFPGLIPPENFIMTALNDSTIACSWSDIPGETSYALVNWPDTTIIHTLSANATADTVSGLYPNSMYSWAILADSSGVKGMSAPDSTATLLSAPEKLDIHIMPVSSDTLRISALAPPNATVGDTGMEVMTISGDGADNSGWMAGMYCFYDGGLDYNSTYIYRVRLRNLEGIASEWTDDIIYTMNGLDSLVVMLPGDVYDNYTVNSDAGQDDSLFVRAGTSDSGDTCDGYFMFTIPWQAQKGGIDSLFITLIRTSEESDQTPTLSLSILPDKFPEPPEIINLGSQEIGTTEISWTVQAGTGVYRSPDLRLLFREWQELDPIRDYPTRFGIRLAGDLNPDGVRAAFLDASHPSYADDTFLTIYYTPGTADSLDAAPDNPDMIVESPDSITVRWEDLSQFELGFLIVNAADSIVIAGIDTLAENSTSTGVGGLTPNTHYQWRVKAFSAVDDSFSTPASVRTFARMPGLTSVQAIDESMLLFMIDPVDNPAETAFAVQDSLSGLYIDGSSEQNTLRAGPPGEWAWQTWDNWGAALGDTLIGLAPDSLFVLRAKARTTDE